MIIIKIMIIIVMIIIIIIIIIKFRSSLATMITVRLEIVAPWTDTS